MNSDRSLKPKKSVLREYLEALLTAGLIALFIRAFVIEAFKIPSGSMIPTLSIGDHIFVNKFIYGLRVPFTSSHFLEFREPKRGEVIVFVYPVDKSKDFIKRVVGVPGDKIHFEGTTVSVNGVELPKKPVEVIENPEDKKTLIVKGASVDRIPYVPDHENYDFYEEETDGTRHLVQYDKAYARPFFDTEVPPGHFFVMGDNRDNSADSREWGFVPAGYVKGKAMFVWLSLDKDQGGIRWHEFGRWVH
jgi:signal peptidase I